MTRLRPYLPALAAAVLGLLLAAGWHLAFGPAPVAYLRADVGTLLFILALIVALGLLIWGTATQRGQRALERAAQAEAESHRRFLQRLDHEIKNPLTAIRAGLANLPPSEDADVVRSVRVQVDRLARLTADLRKLADLETQPLEREQVDLAELITEAFDEVQGRLEAAQRQIRMTIPRAPWPLPAVSGDRDLLFLAVHNLLDNAVKYSRAGDTLELRAFEDGAGVVVEVADTGTGIPPNELPQVWDELYRGQGARGVPGSGLGLALVRAIVERHGGQVMVRSRPGQGTVFTLRLPVR